jgi:hypothetical protein
VAASRCEEAGMIPHVPSRRGIETFEGISLAFEHMNWMQALNLRP